MGCIGYHTVATRGSSVVTKYTREFRLNYYVQVVLDRIVFIRVCESKGIEELEKLKHFEKEPAGFWNTFKTSCYMEFYNHYDGAMFERDEVFQNITLRDDTFTDFIAQLYYPYPYKFDVIPVKAIANIYEEFLGKQLSIINGRIEEVSKDEYIRTNGAIATPEHIVEMVCKQTICINSISHIDDLLKTTILEKTLPTLIQTNETKKSTQIDAFFESKPKIDAFLDPKSRIMRTQTTHLQAVLR